jgi:methyltransferase (TIGR00027 family)
MVSTTSPDVAWTSMLTAYARAQETRRPDPLFSDELAGRFVSAYAGDFGQGNALPDLGPANDRGSSPLWNGFSFYLAMRTPFFDEGILRAAPRTPQVVVLGAGLDSRAFRLGLGRETTVFEIDRAPVQKFKSDVLDQVGAEPTCVRRTIAADMVTDDLADALIDAGFDEQKPTCWVAEGLFVYLTSAECDDLLAAIESLSASGSTLLGEYQSRRWQDSDVAFASMDARDQKIWRELNRSQSRGLVNDDPATWMREHGWHPSAITDLARLGRETGRDVPFYFGGSGAPKVWLFEGRESWHH